MVRALASSYARRAGLASGLGKLVEVEGRARQRYVGPGGHELRHHHASVLLSKGVSPALVAERLGHDLKRLLRTYAHVIRQDEDRVRAIVDVTLGGDEGRCGPGGRSDWGSPRWLSDVCRAHQTTPTGTASAPALFRAGGTRRDLVSGYAYERTFAVASGLIWRL
jgi:hypothetical protein